MASFKVDAIAREEILNGAERRCRWSDAEKCRSLEETFAPGAHVVDVARLNGIATSLVFAWRRQAREAAPPRLGACLMLLSR